MVVINGTVEQALQQGVAARKRVSFGMLNVYMKSCSPSKDTDANHNLGVLAVAFNKVGSALPLFPCPWSHPKIEQFWLTYWCLIKVAFANAEQVLKEAGRVSPDRLNSLTAHLSPNLQNPPVGVNPPQEQINKLLGHIRVAGWQK